MPGLQNGLYETIRMTERNYKNGTTERFARSGTQTKAPVGPRRGAPTTFLNQHPFETPPVKDAIKINSNIVNIAGRRAGAVGEAAGEAAAIIPKAGSGLKGMLAAAGRFLGGIARIASPLNYVFIASELYKSRGNLLDGNEKIVSQEAEMAALAKAEGRRKHCENQKTVIRTY